jgi:hypothetical protein
MTYLLGTDEAGYGPNLGPLVVSATLWQVPDELDDVDLYDQLNEVVRRRPDDCGRADRLAIADSKILYKPGGGLGRLELGVLATLSALGNCPRTWRQLWTRLAPESDPDRECLPWYADFDASLPVAVDSDRLTETADRFQAGLNNAGLRLCGVNSTAVHPQRFNRLIHELGNKSAALSHVTLQLVGHMLQPLPFGPISVVCDKHGGRNRYGPLLQQHFPEHLVEVCHEGRVQSLYRTGPSHRRMKFCFQIKGEQFLPAALASMVSKYLRELSMKAFNQFWQRKQPSLRPTAGYPVDAKRFKRQIADLQKQLAIDDDILWRSR